MTTRQTAPALPAELHTAARNLLAAIEQADGEAAAIDTQLRKFASGYPTPVAASAALAAVLLVEHATEVDVADAVEPKRTRMHPGRVVVSQ